MIRRLPAAVAALMFVAAPAVAQVDPAARGLAAAALSNAPQTYLGEVATRAALQDSTNSGLKQAMSRSLHIARDNISQLKICIANWYVGSGSPEAGSGATMSTTASIEYPANTLTQVTFSGGSTTGTIPNDTTLCSDWVTPSVAIPRGATFFVRKWESSAGGIVFNDIKNIDLANGEALNYGSTVPDQTMSGSVTNNAGNSVNSSQPVAIIAYTNRPTACLMGDSRVEGQKDSISNNGDDVGEFARSVGPFYAYINLGASGDRVSMAITGNNYTNRLALSKYCTFIFSDYGVNDLYGGGQSAATVWANLQTYYALFAGKPIIQATIWPETTSTDTWTSVVNQTISSVTANPQRVALNQLIRSAPYPLVAVLDDTSAVETALDSGLWNFAGSFQVTAGTYTSGTGAFSLTTAVAHNIQVGENFYVQLTTTGSPNPYYAFVTATAGTSGTTLNFTGAASLGITGITSGAVNGWTREGTHATPVGYIAIKQYNQPLIREIMGGKP